MVHPYICIVLSVTLETCIANATQCVQVYTAACLCVCMCSVCVCCVCCVCVLCVYIILQYYFSTLVTAFVLKGL